MEVWGLREERRDGRRANSKGSYPSLPPIRESHAATAAQKAGTEDGGISAPSARDGEAVAPVGSVRSEGGGRRGGRGEGEREGSSLEAAPSPERC